MLFSCLRERCFVRAAAGLALQLPFGKRPVINKTGNAACPDKIPGLYVVRLEFYLMSTEHSLTVILDSFSTSIKEAVLNAFFHFFGCAICQRFSGRSLRRIVGCGCEKMRDGLADFIFRHFARPLAGIRFRQRIEHRPFAALILSAASATNSSNRRLSVGAALSATAQIPLISRRQWSSSPIS